MAATDRCETLPAAADRLAAMPRFDAALVQYSVGLSRFRRAPRIVNKLVAHDARWRVIGYLLYLHTDREVYGPEGGATYGRLLDLCTRRKEVGPRVMKTVLALMRITGFVETRRSAIDRRVKYYRPTERIYHFMRLWLAYGVEALDILEPERQRTLMLRDDPGFMDRFLVSGGRDHLTGTPPADHLPEFTSFFGPREGAFTVVVALMLAELQGTAAPSRGAIARHFGLSKTQVSNILVEGASRGLFALDQSGTPTATAKLRGYYRGWVAIELAFYARHMQPALAG